jgi:hypothetical protein
MNAPAQGRNLTVTYSFLQMMAATAGPAISGEALGLRSRQTRTAALNASRVSGVLLIVVL